MTFEAARTARRNAHNTYLRAQREFVWGLATAADVDAAQAAFYAAGDAEHAAAAQEADDAKRLARMERFLVAQANANRWRRLYGY